MMESRTKAFILLLAVYVCINIPSIICETVTDDSCSSDSADCHISCTIAGCPSELNCPTTTDCDTCIIDCNDREACDAITIYTHSCSNVTINCDGSGGNSDFDVVTGSTIYTPTNFGDITLNTIAGKGCFDDVSIISPADSGSVVLNCDGTNTISLECKSIDINATYAKNFAMICSNDADCSGANIICPDNDYMVDADWGSTSCYIGCDDNSPDCTSQTIVTSGVNDYTQSLTFECSESGVCSSSTITCDIGTCDIQYINNEYACYGDCGATYNPTNEPSPLPTVIPSAAPTTTGSSGSSSGSGSGSSSSSSSSGDSSGYVIAIVVISCICFIGCIGGIIFMLFHSKQSNEKLKEMSQKIEQLAKNDGSNKHPEFDEIPGSSQQSPRYDSNDTGDTAAAAMHTGTSVYGRPSGIAHGGEGGEGGEGGRASNINAEDLEGIGIHGGNNVTGWVPNAGGGGMAIDEEVDDDDDDDAKMGGNKQNNSDNNKKDNNRHSNHFSDGLKNIGAGLNSLEVDLIDQMNEDKETPQGQGQENDDGYDGNDNINRNSNIKPHAIVFDDNDNENENDDNKDDNKDDSKKNKNNNDNNNNKNTNNNIDKNKGNDKNDDNEFDDEINTKGYDDDNDDKNKNKNKLNGRTNTDDIMATPGDDDDDDDNDNDNDNNNDDDDDGGGGPGYSAEKSPSNESVKRQRLESDVSMMDDEDGVDTIQ